MIGPQLGRESEVSTQEGGTKLRDKLFAGVPFIAVALTSEIPVKPRRMASPMGLMPISA